MEQNKLSLITPSREWACPECGAAAERFPIEAEVSPLFCLKCKGLWFEAGMLARLLGTIKDLPEIHIMHVGAEETQHPCPCCMGLRLVKVHYARDGELMVEWCRKCDGIWLRSSDLEEARRLSVNHKTTPNTKAALAAAAPVLRDFDKVNHGIPYDDIRINAAAIPVAALVAYVAKVTEIPAIPLELFRTALHQFGHAIFSLVSSHATTALPMGIPVSADSRSIIVYSVELVFVGLALYIGFQSASLFVLALTSLYFVALQYFTFFATPEKARLLMLCGGLSGEFYLGMLLVISFYYRMPERIRWDFWRFPAIVLGLYSFGAAFQEWHSLASSSTMPWASALERGDADFRQLNQLFGWDGKRITSTAIRSGFVCAAIIATHYTIFLFSKKETED